MPLPQPKLDDKTFDVLVEASTKLIPRYSPEWTDHNRHDPGITLIELFAWLTEMQQFYLDAIGPESYLKFLKLLGTEPAPAAAARTQVNFRVPRSTLAAGITADATSLKVGSGDGATFPKTPFKAIIWNQTDYLEPSLDPYVEHIRVIGILADSFTIERDEGLPHKQSGKSYGIIVDPDGPVSIPRHTKLRNESLETEGQLIFETAAPLLVLPLKLKRILTTTLRGFKDNTGANDWDGLSYFAFGDDANANSRLYLGFDRPFPAGEQIALTFDLVEDYEVARGKHGPEDTPPMPSALVTWEYYNTKQEWAPLEIIAAIDNIVTRIEQAQAASTACFGAFDKLFDEIKQSPAYAGLDQAARQFIVEAVGRARSLADVRRFLCDAQFLLAKGDTTLMFSQSGRLFFKAPGDIGRYIGQSLIESGLFWVRATLRRSGYELAPQVDSISINTIDVFQRDTLAEALSFSSTGAPDQTFNADSYLAVYGQSLVQVREDDDLWKYWEEQADLNSSGPNQQHYVIKQDPVTGTATITFGDGKNGQIPGQGEDRIRLLSCLSDFEEEQKLGSSNGLPGQSFSLERSHVLANALRIQIKERIRVPRTFTETIKISCLATFSRTVTMKDDDTVEVKLLVKANTELCNVSVEEKLHGDLSFAQSEGETPDDSVPVFEKGRMPSGSSSDWPPYILKVGSGGGSIDGRIKISTGTGCPDMTEASPISIVEFEPPAEDFRWRDWILVDDLDASGPNDAHFIFDASANAIAFGDGINGDVPQAALDDNGDVDRNIRIIAMQTSDGENGNVVRNTIRGFADPALLPADQRSLYASHVIAASGGAATEALADAQARARADLRTQYQAVTSDDYEFLAINTPGLRVARAKAIPCFSAAGKPEPKASVTVVVLPYSTSAKPVPSENFLLNVCRHLDRHRLITTRVEVVAPNYVRVSVQATVLLQPGFEIEASRQKIIKALNRFLRPVPEPGDKENLGWTFGRTVFKSEIYELIEKVEGVDCVEKVVLTAEGSGAARDANGNITITPTSVVFSGDHQVEVVTPELQCRSGQ